MSFEKTIFGNLVFREDYGRKVFPFLKQEYFQDIADRTIFDVLSNYVHKYNSFPTQEALMIELEAKDNLDQKVFAGAKELIEELDFDPGTELDFLVDNTEKFCQEKAVYNGIMESIQILDNSKDSKLSKGSIPQILTDALAVSFDSNIGHNWMEDSEARFEFYNRKETKVPFGLDYFNRITEGGLPNKTLNIILAGCVHPDTKIKIRYRKTEWQEKEIKIGDIAEYISAGYEIEVTSPDGFVSVSMFVDKGEWDEYILETDDSRVVRVNENHLFETKNGWEYAKNLTSDYHLFLTDCGYVRGIVQKTNNKIPIVDIQVDHENHRYYTNGISSHNTGVGKSLFMCSCAADNLMAGKNVLYITMELAEERVAERIDANLLDVPVKELGKMDKSLYFKKIDRIKSKTMGKLIVKEYPTSSAGSSNFRYLLNELKLKKNFHPDIVYIDYLNICSSSRMKYSANMNSYTYVKAIAEELRGLAVEFNVPIVSATQTTRSGFCLALDTKVVVNNQKTNILEVKVGDRIDTVGGQNTVKHIFPITKKKAYKITLANGKTIICSKEHLFPTKSGEKSIKNGLKIGEYLQVK